MSDYLSSVLDELVPTYADEDGDWERVVADAGAATPTTTAQPWLVDTAAPSVAPRPRPGRQPAQWLTRRRLVASAVTALLAMLLVAPALGIGERLLDLIQGESLPPDVQTPAWSPDGRNILFLRRHTRGHWDVFLVDAEGGNGRVLARNAHFDTPAWSPDGRKIVYRRRPCPEPGSCVGNPELYVINVDGSGLRILARRGHAPAWSPDGRTIAFVSNFIYVMDADGKERRRVARAGGASNSLVWSPDGQRIAFLTDAGTVGVGQFCYPVWVVNADGTGERILTGSLKGPCHKSPAWSPDGRKIAFVRTQPGRGDAGALFVMNADGSGLRGLTHLVEQAGAPRWSPDGRKIVFGSEVADLPDSGGEVYVMNADGTGRRNLTRNPAHDTDPAWSPDGRKIAFVSDRDGEYEVYVMNADGSGQRKLTTRRGG
jgi:TolB protein